MRSLALGMALLLGWSAPAAAQQAPVPPPATPAFLTLREALDMALRQHPAPAAAARRLRGAEAWTRGAGAQPNPELRVAATLGDAGEDANILAQRLEIAGQPGLRSAAARAGAEAARHDLQATRREVARRTAAAYYALWQAEAGLGVARDRLELARRLEETSRVRLEVGEISENAHLRTQLEVARAEADLAEASGQALAERSRLNLLLGRSPGQPVLLPPSPEAAEPRAPEGFGPPGSLEEMRNRALGLPELESLRSAARAARLEAELAGRSRAPDLELSAYRSRLAGTGAEQGVQVSLVVPLWDYGRIAAEQARLRLEAEARDLDVSARALEVQTEIAVQLQILEASEARREILRTQLARARRLAEMARVGYEAGLLSLPEVLDAQQAHSAALSDFVSAEAAVRRSEAELYLLSGGPLAGAPEGDLP